MKEPQGDAADFYKWFDEQVGMNDEDYPSPEEIGFARAAWDAAKMTKPSLSPEIATLIREIRSGAGWPLRDGTVPIDQITLLKLLDALEGKS